MRTNQEKSNKITRELLKHPASTGGDSDTARSTSGYLLCIGTGAVSWSSKLQSIVALSTTAAEFVAAVEAGKEMALSLSVVCLASHLGLQCPLL